MLTIKTLALIALSSSDRGQTLFLLNVDNLFFYENRITFVIHNRLKTSEKEVKPHLVECYKNELPR